MKARKTKIVCTVGPACENEEIIREMCRCGMDVARFNFSHGDHKWHSRMMKLIKDVNSEREFPITTILDLQGPELRLHVKRAFRVKSGDEVVFVNEKCNEDEVVINDEFFENMEAGNRVLVNDGMVELVVESCEKKRVVCRAVNEGVIENRKSVNIPGIDTGVSSLTGKDKEDVLLGTRLGVDYIAMSFVRSVENINELKNMLRKKDVGIIAKIECESAVRNFDKIVDASDAIMIARGDLGVEVAFEKLPLIQKEIIKKCNEKGKPVIVATHMLNSMIDCPRPTRAEVVDVSSAVIDGADAVMLSAETANGKYPVDSVKVMDKIVREAELAIKPNFYIGNGSKNISEIVAKAVAQVSDSVDARAIITITKTGNTAKNIARHRTMSPIFVFSDEEFIRKKHSLLWGTYTYIIEEKGLDEMIEKGIEILKKSGKIENGDVVVLTAGVIDGGLRSLAEVRIVT